MYDCGLSKDFCIGDEPTMGLACHRRDPVTSCKWKLGPRIPRRRFWLFLVTAQRRESIVAWCKGKSLRTSGDEIGERFGDTATT